MTENEESTVTIETIITKSAGTDDTSHDIELLEEILACLAGTN